MNQFPTTASLALFLSAILAATGCQPGPSAELIEARKQLVSSGQLENAMSLAELRAKLTDDPAEEVESNEDESADQAAVDSDQVVPPEPNISDDAPASDSGPVPAVLVAQIGGAKPTGELDGFPWSTNRAEFYVSDPDDHDHADGKECAFCARRKRLNWVQLHAQVKIVDADGNVAPFSISELLEAEEGQTVILDGLAELQPMGMLEFTATKVVVQR